MALKAESGKGKSTIAKLILGLYPVKEGKIFIKGKAYEEYPLAEVRQLIGYVPQEPYLYDVSVAENIRYGRPGASQEDIINAASASSVAAATADTTEDTTAITTAKRMIKSPPAKSKNIKYAPL